MKIKERLNNKVFIVAVISFIVMVAKQFNLFTVPDNWEQLLDMLLNILIMAGIIINPTTPGIKDGE